MMLLQYSFNVDFLCTLEVASGKGPLTVINKMAGRARNFTKGIKKAAGHLRRLGDENDRER